ncbi:hypothetical protein [Streptomyces noursei]|uniref:hypothetical protein n=1 Tax=Streptomyces noursei TaxID=1971 RepID=UPI0023B84DEC|nr:hypothetical protein [Streptomyces noursei]
MALGCPRCKESNQVLHLPEFWKSLPKESELRDEYAPPLEFRMQWLYPVVAGGLGVVALVTGGVAAGVLLLAGGVGVGFWLSGRARAAEDARAKWSRSWICRRCPATFLREEALAV